jgi:hypothetical protein
LLWVRIDPLTLIEKRLNYNAHRLPYPLAAPPTFALSAPGKLIQAKRCASALSSPFGHIGPFDRYLVIASGGETVE